MRFPNIRVLGVTDAENVTQYDEWSPQTTSTHTYILLEVAPCYQNAHFLDKFWHTDRRGVQTAELTLPLPYVYYVADWNHIIREFGNTKYEHSRSIDNQIYCNVTKIACRATPITNLSSILYQLPVPNIYEGGLICNHTYHKDIPAETPPLIKAFHAIQEFWDTPFSYYNHMLKAVTTLNEMFDNTLERVPNQYSWRGKKGFIHTYQEWAKLPLEEVTKDNKLLWGDTPLGTLEDFARAAGIKPVFTRAKASLP